NPSGPAGIRAAQQAGYKTAVLLSDHHPINGLLSRRRPYKTFPKDLAGREAVIVRSEVSEEVPTIRLKSARRYPSFFKADF
ncbi:hypothetical protein, partial [Lysobacter sp. CA199]|uniref:hypothetical protein n=1 Tax=Lysobacter sp. CA199 TaxID=3455608 RepID=UPI003F8D0B24